jgi:hypothetical protein
MHTSKRDYVDPVWENAIPGETLACTVWRETKLEGLVENIEDKWFRKCYFIYSTS